MHEEAHRAERRRQEKRLAGVAHEINNPLAVIAANLELALQAIDAATARGEAATELYLLRALLGDAHESAARLRDIVRDLQVSSRSQEKAASGDEAGAPAGAVSRGRVLVVDDEVLVARSLEVSLAADHDVTMELDARAALARISRGERFDVILCDLMMPEMTGMDLHAEVERLAPDQASRMVFLTGGAFTAEARSFLDRTEQTVIEKPFDVARVRVLVADRMRR